MRNHWLKRRADRAEFWFHWLTPSTSGWVCAVVTPTRKEFDRGVMFFHVTHKLLQSIWGGPVIWGVVHAQTAIYVQVDKLLVEHWPIDNAALSGWYAGDVGVLCLYSPSLPQIDSRYFKVNA